MSSFFFFHFKVQNVTASVSEGFLKSSAIVMVLINEVKLSSCTDWDVFFKVLEEIFINSKTVSVYNQVPQGFRHQPENVFHVCKQ